MINIPSRVWRPGAGASLCVRRGRARLLTLVGLVAIALAILGATGSEAFAAAVPSSLVNTIDTSTWSPASPDPSGLAYNPATNRLVVSDGEVDEMSIYRDVNYYEATLGGSLARTGDTTDFTKEPVGLALDPPGSGSAGARTFFSDDDAGRVYEVALGSDGVFNRGDPVKSFSTTTFASADPEGLAYDPEGDRIFIADGVDAEIYMVSAVDGTFGDADDKVTHFDTRLADVGDPETVEFDPASGHVFTIGSNGDKIVEMTTAGAVVSEIDTSNLPFMHPAGLAYAPKSTDSSKKSFYVADRNVDNNIDPRENDGKIYEITPDPTGGTPPGDVRVAAGADDAEETAGGSMSLTSGDLELVTDTSAQTVGVRFGDLGIPAGATITNAHIQFVADESQSEPTSLSVQAHAADTAPTFGTSSSNISSRPRTAASVPWSPAAWTAGQGGADQRTPDLRSVVQEVVDRPGWANGNAMAFIVRGSGHRTAETFEGSATKAPLLHVEYLPPTGNRPPSVNAGPDQTVAQDAGAALDGTVSDDGRPNPAPTTTWTKMSGPGTVTFANAGSVDTPATFSQAGTYVLRLTADDGELTTVDDVTIVVEPPGRRTLDVRIGAGTDDVEERATGSVSLSSADLELVTDATVQKVGLRFAGLGIPRGARISSAYVQFTADEAGSDPTSLTFQAQAADNAATFADTTANVSGRPRTTASAGWSPVSWIAGGAGADQRTPDLAAAVQEVVNRPGWTSGNAMAFIVAGSGRRTAESFEGSATKAPVLHVEYE